MTKIRYFYVAAILHLSSILAYIYLSTRSQALKLGEASERSMCQLGGQWDCDNALTSVFSEVFGVPLSYIGLALQIVCLVLLVLIQINWLKQVQIWSDWVWRISIGLALASICMLIISLMYLDTMCPMCTICYLASWLILWPLKRGLPSSQIFNLKPPSLNLIARTGAYLLVAVLSITFLTHAFISELYPVKDLEEISQSSLIDWLESETVSIPNNISPVVKGVSASQARWTLVEFVDFLCGHCKKAHQIISQFHKHHPLIRVELMHFPLDPRGCSKDKASKESLSCTLAKSSQCAHQQGLQFAMVDHLFSDQFQNDVRKNPGNASALIETFLSKKQIHLKKFKKCLQSAQTKQMIMKQKQAGHKLGIKGTPALFVDEKPVYLPALYLTLSKIYQNAE